VETVQPVEPTDTIQARVSGRAIASLVLGLSSLLLGCLMGIPAAILGFSALNDIRRSNGRVVGRGMALSGLILGCVMTCVTFLVIGIPAVLAFFETKQRFQAANHLKQIGLAIHNYHDTYKAIPWSGVEYPSDPAAPPRMQLSWRVRLLPFLGFQRLYDRFNFDEPWDSVNNRTLIQEMPEIYQSPTRKVKDNKTIYLAVVFPREVVVPADLPQHNNWFTAFDTVDSEGRRPQHDRTRSVRSSFADIGDGLGDTIFVVEANSDQAVIWTKPDDWELHLDSPKRGLGSLRPGGFMVLMGDGSITFLPNGLDDETVRNLCLSADGNQIKLER
jgi:hypothetical protein